LLRLQPLPDEDVRFLESSISKYQRIYSEKSPSTSHSSRFCRVF